MASGLLVDYFLNFQNSLFTDLNSGSWINQHHQTCILKKITITISTEGML